MKRQTWSGMVTAAVFAISGVVMAQSPATPPSPSSQTSTTSSATTPASSSQSTSQTAGADKITVTGCLREAGQSATATSGSAAPAATDSKANAGAEGKYVVADATPKSSSASGAGSPQTYRLIANDSALAPHVGKKLELTGTVVDRTASTSSGPRASRTSRCASPTGNTAGCSA